VLAFIYMLATANSTMVPAALTIAPSTIAASMPNSPAAKAPVAILTIILIATVASTAALDVALVATSLGTDVSRVPFAGTSTPALLSSSAPRAPAFQNPCASGAHKALPSMLALPGGAAHSVLLIARYTLMRASALGGGGGGGAELTIRAA
jgi:hypothetical protein